MRAMATQRHPDAAANPRNLGIGIYSALSGGPASRPGLSGREGEFHRADRDTYADLALSPGLRVRGEGQSRLLAAPELGDVAAHRRAAEVAARRPHHPLAAERAPGHLDVRDGDRSR